MQITSLPAETGLFGFKSIAAGSIMYFMTTTLKVPKKTVNITQTEWQNQQIRTQHNSFSMSACTGQTEKATDSLDPHSTLAACTPVA